MERVVELSQEQKASGWQAQEQPRDVAEPILLPDLQLKAQMFGDHGHVKAELGHSPV